MSLELTPFSGLWWHEAHTWAYINTFRQIFIHIKNNEKFQIYLWQKHDIYMCTHKFDFYTQVWFFYFQYTLIANSTWVSPHCLNLPTVNSNIRNSINFVFLFSFSFGFLICLHLNSYKLSQCTAVLLGFPFPTVPRTPCTFYLDPLGYHSAGSHFAVAFHNVCKIPFLRLEMFVLLPPHHHSEAFWTQATVTAFPITFN